MVLSPASVFYMNTVTGSKHITSDTQCFSMIFSSCLL